MRDEIVFISHLTSHFSTLVSHLFIMQKVTFIDLGSINYADALHIQTQKFNELIETKMQAQSNADAHTLFLCEHEPVITLGKAANQQNILLPEALLRKRELMSYTSTEAAMSRFTVRDSLQAIRFWIWNYSPRILNCICACWKRS
jgi:hypothetical protein